MPNYLTIPGVYDAATGQFTSTPNYQFGDATISVNGGPFVPATHVPEIVVPGAFLSRLELTDAEYKSSAIVKFVDLEGLWVGPEVSDIVESQIQIDNSPLVNQIEDLKKRVTNPVISASTFGDVQNIELFHHDNYQGGQRGELRWDTTVDYSDKEAAFIIFDPHNSDTIYLQESVTVATSDFISVSVNVELIRKPRFRGCKASAELAYVLVVDGTETIAAGTAIVYDRPEISAP